MRSDKTSVSEETAKKVASYCRRESNGLVRGEVPKVACHECGEERLNDGTPCWNCGEYWKEVKLRPIPQDTPCIRCGRQGTAYSYGYPVCGNNRCRSAAKLMKDATVRHPKGAVN